MKFKFLAALLIFSTCIREIDLKTETGDLTTLVVEGDFTNSTGTHRVVLTHPNQYGISAFERVAGAKIWLSDDAGNRVEYFEKSDSTGVFYELAAGAMAAQIGRGYQISIELPDGKKYQSALQKLPEVTRVDSVWLEGRLEKRVSSEDVVVEEKMIVVQLQTLLPDASGETFLRWGADCVYLFPELQRPGTLPPPSKTCYVWDYFNRQRAPIQQVAGSGQRKVFQEIGTRPNDYAFDFQAYFTIVQRTISPQAYQFFKNVQQVSNPAGTIFDPPPGAILGNLTNVADPNDRALGFFEVAAVDTFRLKVQKGQLPPGYQPQIHCEESDFWWNRDAECFDCLRLENSTLRKPHFWK